MSVDHSILISVDRNEWVFFSLFLLAVLEYFVIEIC